MTDDGRSLEELLAIATIGDNWLSWPEVLTPAEIERVRRYLMDLHGING